MVRAELRLLGSKSGDALAGFVPKGPYVFRGGAEHEGAELPEGATTDHFTLCRCGHSKNKPFCSGAHWDVEFDEDALRKNWQASTPTGHPELGNLA